MYSVAVEGEENVPLSGPCILLSNHASYLDPVFLVAACNRYVRFFTTGEMMRTRVGRWFFNAMGSIPTSRYRVDSASVRAFLAALKSGDIVGIFPEGERTWDGNPLPINPTVVRLLKRSNVPIVAARIDGSYAIYPRWSSYLLPGRINVRFFAPSSSDQILEVLSRIRTNETGYTMFPRSARGLERLIWACPAEWTLDCSMNVHASNGTSVSLREFVSFLSREDFFRETDTLSSIGKVDLLIGGEELSPVASGEVVYRDGSLHVGGMSFSISEARIIRLEGKDRLDIGFEQGRRLRLVLHRDSPLKWEQFLHVKLGIEF
jgi:1-acyl-sn-glycerol-3-phosphate acyltransferase